MWPSPPWPSGDSFTLPPPPSVSTYIPPLSLADLTPRDLLVCLFVLPAALDWLLAGLTSWPGGQLWCQTAVFFDYYLNIMHPLLILMLCLILYTRKLPAILPSGTPLPPQPVDSRLSSRSGYTRQAPYRQAGTPYRQSDISQVAHSVRAPSVAGSVLSNSSRHEGFRKGFSKGAGGGSPPRSHSTTGGSYRESARGPLPSVSGSITVSGSVAGHGRGRPNFSPPPMNSTLVEEEYLDHEDGELWELASMEYPGKAEDQMDLQVI